MQWVWYCCFGDARAVGRCYPSIMVAYMKLSVVSWLICEAVVEAESERQGSA